MSDAKSLSVAQVTGTWVPVPVSEYLGDKDPASREGDDSTSREGEDSLGSSTQIARKATLGDEDVRGQAGFTPQGVIVRAHEGTKRPPNIEPQIW